MHNCMNVWCATFEILESHVYACIVITHGIDTTHISAANKKYIKPSNSLTVNKNMIYETSCLMNVE